MENLSCVPRRAGAKPSTLRKLGGMRGSCAVFPLCIATALASSAQTFTTLFSFDGTDGAYPEYPLVLSADGNFYGITSSGGANAPCPDGNASGCGTIFEITPSAALTTLHSFNWTDGLGSGAKLIQGSGGTFYGTTTGGGTNGNGTIFSIIPGGSLVSLYSFCSQINCADGASPNGLVQGNDGNFYGSTYGAGLEECPSSCGTLFKITPAGALTTLYTFPSGPGITGPSYWPAYEPSGVVPGTDGNFYGPAFGGNQLCGLGNAYYAYCGTLFKVTPAGALTTLYSFCTQPGCIDGFGSSGLVQGPDGNFYGTTEYGGKGCFEVVWGPYYGCGTVFKITPEGTFTTLHLFDWTDGARPNGVLAGGSVGNGLILGSDGNFYGTTAFGGANNAGTIFRITPEGSLITLYSFVQTSSSGSPGPGGMVQAADGTFYGTTSNDGANSDGTIFTFSIGLGGTAASTTALGLSPATVTVGAAGPIVMTATVAPTTGSGTPTGVVNFFNGSTEIGLANLSSGVGAFNYNPSSLGIDAYAISAVYNGDGTFATSTSSAETLTISSLPAAATPSFSTAAGTYRSAQTVTITDATTGATIYYTNDGTTPTTSSAVYNGPITVSSTETLKAIAAANGYLSSGVATATYTITLSPDYELAVTPATLTIVAGQSGTATFTVTPMNGFNSQVSFACSGLPSGVKCTFNPQSVTPGGGPASSTLTVSTAAASVAFRGLTPSSYYPIYALFLPFLGIFVNIAASLKRPHGGWRVFGTFALLMLVVGLISCGDSSHQGNPGRSPGMSTATITASTSGSGAINHTVTLTITVTQ